MSDRFQAFVKKHLAVVRVALILLTAGILTFCSLLSFVLFGAHDHIEGDPDTMLILGCQVHDWGPSVLLQDRLDTALDYLEDHPGMTVVVSGGQGPDEPTSEARAMADYLTNRGVQPEYILLEEDSHNTYENFLCSARLMREVGISPEDEILVVSNGFHLTRARLLADRTGFECVSVLAAPSSHIPSRMKMYIREPLALLKSLVLDR